MNRLKSLRRGVTVSSIAAPVDLRFEHRTDGDGVLGIGTSTPRLSWVVPSAPRSYEQAAYDVEVGRDSGETAIFPIDGAEQVLVPWPATPLRSRERATVAFAYLGRHPVRLVCTGDRGARPPRPRGLDGPVHQPIEPRHDRRTRPDPRQRAELPAIAPVGTRVRCTSRPVRPDSRRCGRASMAGS